MDTYPEVTVDINPPSRLLMYYRIHGVFALLFNLLGVFLIYKNPRIVKLYRGFMINMQVFSLIADAQNTLLMQPVYLFPVLAGYTNGILWHVFGVSSHMQMGVFLLLLYLQVAAIVCAIVTKYQVLASIGNKFPNAVNILTIPSVEVYDLMANKWMLVTSCLIVVMLTVRFCITYN
uniref:Uncharacterized protein n=1 Tax=Caenorhabditis japonica TaxID=281687 RepID=A0A8R1I2V3_CAEJA